MQQKGKEKVVAGLVLTIESDDEAEPSELNRERKGSSQPNSSGASAAPNKPFSGKGESRGNAERSSELGSESGEDEDEDQVMAGVILDDLQVESEESSDEYGVRDSWNLKNAIEKIKEKEGKAQEVTTSLDEKIAKALKARALRQAEKEFVEGVGGKQPLKEAAEEEEGSSDTEDFSREIGQKSAALQKVKALKEMEQAKNDPQKIFSFAELNLSAPLLRATKALQFTKPTPIQAKAIPHALAGRDICGSAATGSGKTAAFVLPVLDRLQFRPKNIRATRVLIITPTRELTQQVQSMIEALARFTDVTSISVVGGLSMEAQAAELRGRPDIVVATPGRIIDHVLNTKSVDLDDVEILILDEADRLLELGFIEAVTQIVHFCPRKRQTLLFSATMTASVEQLAGLSLRNPVRVETDPLYDMAMRLVQEFVRIKPNREDDREAMLFALCTRTFKSKVIIFFQKKSHAHRAGILFGLSHLRACELHGNMSQRQRLESLEKFRDGETDFLLCTDVASRGLDIKGIETVINYEMPQDLSTYVHRVGRTARAGRGGRAITLTSEKRRKLTKEVLKRSQQNVKARTIPDSVVQALKDRIADYQEEVEDVLRQERVEKELRIAEIVAERASKLIKNRNKPQTEPKRIWYQSEKEKRLIRIAAKEIMAQTERKAQDQTPEGRKVARKRALEEVMAAGEAKKTKKNEKDVEKRASTKKIKEAKRRAQIEEDFKRARAEALEAKAAGKTFDETLLKRKSPFPSERELKISVKRAKKELRSKEDARTDQILTKDVDAKSRNGSKPPKKRVKIGASELAGFHRELAPGEGLSMLAARGKSKTRGKREAPVFKEADLSKGGLKKGGKLGSSKFKSKSKHKRR